MSQDAIFLGESACFAGKKVLQTLYGENAYQESAGLYAMPGCGDPLALDRFKLLEGDPPSFNNLADIDRLLQTLTHISTALSANLAGAGKAVMVCVKHGNPCGAAFDEGYYKYSSIVRKAITGDSRAVFGGLVMCNFIITEECALAMLTEGLPWEGKRVLDAVIAPSVSPEACEVLKRKTGRCRIMVNSALGIDSMPLDSSPRFRHVRGGFLKQPNYTFVLGFSDPDMEVFGQRDHAAEPDLLLAWAVGCTSNSNTITIVNDCMLIGNGVGQQDRVGAAELAIKRATDAGHKDMLQGAVAYSDSFFPFTDAVEVLINAGIRAIFSTSGSVNDDKVQKLCMDRGVVLYQLPDKKARGFFGH